MKNILKLIIIIFIQLLLCKNSYSENVYNFRFLLCDSLKNAEYNFGLENRKKNLIVYKLDSKNFKKTRIELNNKNPIIYLNKTNYIPKKIYLNLLNRQFYISENDEFLGGCFDVKSQKILKCKLQSYYNVFKKKLPLSCN
tara:strand:- start:191 stop:610 length:420 start_codon:yes stop_codon:yes gene_type:complete